jgi:anthranilate synthase component I
MTAFNLELEDYRAVVENQAKPLIIPLAMETDLPGVSPADLYSAMEGTHGFLLESLEGSEKVARYSFIGIELQLLASIDGAVELSGNRAFTAIAESPEGETPVDRIRSILGRFNFVNVKAPRFFGGMVGYFAYDLVYALSGKVQAKRERDVNTPAAQFMLTKNCIVFDHTKKRLYIFDTPLLTYETDIDRAYQRSRTDIHRIKEKIDRACKKVQNRNEPVTCRHNRHLSYSSNTSREEFIQAVERAKEHIYAGDIFQVVLSRRVTSDLKTDPFSIYRALHEINPSPYMYYLNFGDLKIIGSSPEMLIRVEKRRLMTVPIAGTRPRGMSREEDERLADELLHDEKERAEHVMLVDLARNDIGCVSKYGTVQVNDFMSIEKFSHVQHIVSTVSGVLKDNLDCFDALKACFPAGTVSGAPKVRAMQIIEDLEKHRRGIYAGAVGYIGFNRNMDFAIGIRTIITTGGKAHVQVGAGIVADSNPENEWNETESKSRAMLRAIEGAR